MRDDANMAFDYMYRDGSNYKQGGRVVFAGCPDDLDLYRDRLKAAMDQEEHFIASQVMVPEVFMWLDGEFPYDKDTDHCWHEFCDVDRTDDPPDDESDRTCEEFLECVESASREGWGVFDPSAEFKRERAFKYA